MAPHAQSRDLTRPSSVADPTRTATPLPPPNAHHPQKNPNRSTNHPSQRPKTKQTRPLTESAPVPPLPSSTSTHKRVEKKAPKEGTKAKNITPSPPRVMVTVRNPTPKLSDELFRAMQTVLDALFNQRDPADSERDLSEAFHDLLPKRQFVDYYKLIKHPQALNPVQLNVKRKTYTVFADFVKDCAQIFHNAKLYNRHDSIIYEDAETLEGTLSTELSKLRDAGVIQQADSELPDLGPLPPPSPSGSQGSPDPEEDSAAEEEEEDEEDDAQEEEEDDGKKRRSSTRRRTGKNVKDDDGEGGNESVRKDMNDPRRKRGRPPRVDTPMEVRVKNVLKALRKLKDEASGNLRINAFEKLPEKKEFPEYFQEIKNPIALDLIRKNVKRREYKTFDQFIADMELMFENAKAFNEDDSQLYQDAVMLQEEMRKAAEIEKARKDEDITGGDEGAGGGGKQLRLPLDHIPHKGENYRVGDWIHIINPNDPNKPTVGQIFRTWKDHDGQIWINACWYYRPEQTVHWENKKFYPDEVVKTGQYRDHHIDEVLGKCFVMFFTRYSRGRPKGIDPKRTPIYVCESRYNEVEKHFNKIKTWKSCIPDEVRGQDYDLDSFEKQQVLKKMPSPILHMLPADAKEDDPLPEAKMGVENAPPIIGAVFRRARRENDSPPPEPTPPPPAPMPTPAPASERPARVINPDYHETMSMTQMYKQAHLAAASVTTTPTAAASPAPQHQQPHARSPMTPYASHHYTPTRQHSSQGYPSAPPSQHHNAAAAASQALPQKQYNPPAPPTTFTLPDSVTHNIPEETAAQFLRDGEGKLLWFTVPPLDAVEGAGAGLGHSVAWLARRKEIEERKRRWVVEKEERGRREKVRLVEERERQKDAAKEVLVRALDVWKGQMRASVGK